MTKQPRTDSQTWSIPGAGGEAILGDTHLPPDGQAPIGHLVIAHGFRGYKDYGILPVLAAEAARNEGLIAHRFNFSHSGMTNHIDTFERPDLFEKDTWGRQIFDLAAVAKAIRAGALPGSGGAAKLPQIWFGHSRGGVTALLTAARAFAPGQYKQSVVGREPSARDDIPQPAGVIPAAAPAFACMLGPDDIALMKKQGYLVRESSRTGQKLRVGLPWLEEYEADPHAFDPLRAASLIGCPVAVIHGDADETVPADCAHMIAQQAKRADTVIIEGASHVFNTSNPANPDRPLPPQGQAMVDAVCDFALRWCGETQS